MRKKKNVQEEGYWTFLQNFNDGVRNPGTLILSLLISCDMGSILKGIKKTSPNRQKQITIPLV